MAIDLFAPRAMTKALKETKPPKTFLRDTFFASRKEFAEEYVDVDVQTRARRLAPFVAPNMEGKVVERLGYTTRTYRSPTVSMKMPTTAETLQKRRPEETLYDGRSPDERAMEQLMDDLETLDHMVARREEWMCAQALFNGSVRILGDGVDETIDFARPAGNTIALPAAASRWDGASAAIIKNLRDWRRICVKASGVAPNIAVLGSDAADALLNDTKVQTLLDARRMELGLLKIEDLPQGVVYHGTLAGLDIYSYDEWYVDPADDTEKPMVPTKEVMLGSSQAQTELRYGAVPLASGEDAAAAITLVMGTRVPDSWVEKDPPCRWLKVGSRPLPVPIQIGAFLKATVLA